MASHEQIATRWAQQAGLDNPKFLRRSGANVIVSERDGRDLYSWGSHFTLARIILDADRKRSWFLVNGDKYSHSTSQHQSITRSAIAGTGLPSMIVPFTALDRARIRYDSIKPVEILPDRYEPVTRYAADRDAVPSWITPELAADGRWSWEDKEHHLGEAVFTATYYTGRWDDDGHPIDATATFLSSFDMQEGWGLYFLAELPQGCNPQTVAEAVQALKPEAVLNAEAQGKIVLRQGDVFAIPYIDTTTRQLTKLGAVRERMAYVLGVNHIATDVAVLDAGTAQRTYGRGIMRHRPREMWRNPEHKTVKLGDGKTWYRLVKNTVPEGRSWSIDGKID